jgi:hypothetical protein
MAQREPSAAQALYGHLPGQQDYVAKQQRPSLAEAMYPRPKPKPPNPYRESLLRGLRELNNKNARMR